MKGRRTGQPPSRAGRYRVEQQGDVAPPAVGARVHREQHAVQHCDEARQVLGDQVCTYDAGLLPSAGELAEGRPAQSRCQASVTQRGGPRSTGGAREHPVRSPPRSTPRVRASGRRGLVEGGDVGGPDRSGDSHRRVPRPVLTARPVRCLVDTTRGHRSRRMATSTFAGRRHAAPDGRQLGRRVRGPEAHRRRAWVSATAYINASARIWPGSRCRSHSPRWRGACPD